MYAPIIIPTLNRVEHLKKCLNSLKCNELANETELFLGVDYPSDERQREGHDEIIDYVRHGIDGFADVHVYIHMNNLGHIGNYLFLLEKISEKYDRYIYTEDDNVFSPNYLKYMNNCLSFYEDDTSVLAISGYMWPIETNCISKVIKNETIFSAWGYGTWVKKEKEFVNSMNIDKLLLVWKNRKLMRNLRRENPFIYSEFVKGFIGYTDYLLVDGEVQPIDLAYSVCMYADRRSVIYPTLSKVRNLGNDGTGVHCVSLKEHKMKARNNRNYDYSKQVIDSDNDFIIDNRMLSECKSCVLEGLKEFLFVSKIELIKCDMAYVFSRILGREKCEKFIKSINS